MKTQTLTLLPALAGLALALLTLPAPAPAQWGSTPDDPLPICTAPGDQTGPLVFRLSSGRYIVTWFDYRTPTVTAYYQLLTEKGEILLQDNGVLVFPGSTWGTAPYFLVSDGQGGCISIVKDYRNGAADIYGQRFDSLGNRMWGETGLPLVVWPGGEDVALKDVEIDSQGFLFLAWVRYIGPGSQLYVQKATLDGLLLWGTYGVMDHTSSTFEDWQQLIPDEQEGVLDVWNHSFDIPYYTYAQHLDANGNFLWLNNGIPLMSPAGSQIEMMVSEIFTDGAGGGIVVGGLSGFGFHYTRVFRLNGQTGTVPWYWSWWEGDPALVDEVQNALTLDVYCLCLRYPSPYQIRLQRIDIDGNAYFGRDGVSITGMSYADQLAATSDGVEVVGVTNSQMNVLVAQRYDSSGRALWRQVFATSDTYFQDWEVCGDGDDGLVAVLRVYAPPSFNLYAMRMRFDGSLGNVLPPYPYAPIYTQRELYLRGNTIVFHLPQTEEVQLQLFDLLGRQVATLAQGAFPSGIHQIPWKAENLPSGIYLLRLTTPTCKVTLKTALVH